MKLDRCRCGRMPAIRTARVDEDAIEAWVQCPGCGAAGHRVEDDVADREAAAMDWNMNGERKA